ncbi:DUF1918 domain-containing protein [Actinomycetospora sp.]|jgi:hypothetical protein|uniref:DUF1918 domain-containing protein n=1 Tax=Actinomycetospora sp. TaxID=1872135 RepID=UPI002F40EE2B
MRGNVGDLITQHGRRVDQADRIGTIVEVRGEDGPFLVHFESRGRCWVFPGPDTEITAAKDLPT